MATYKEMGDTYKIIYRYNSSEGKKQQWETYTSELEALQRQAYIEFLEKSKSYDELAKAATEYRRKRAGEKAAANATNGNALAPIRNAPPAVEDNTQKTYREFSGKWLPFSARKKRFSPNTYDSYTRNLNIHILPYFGEKIMSTISAEDIDNFIDFLSNKPCGGSKSYNKDPDDIPVLSSGTIKKCYNILTSGFTVAKKWGYITEIPETTAPVEKWVKRKSWEPERVHAALAGIKEDKLLHLAVHIAFVCSLRAGETAGIDIQTIDFDDHSLWITQEVQRVTDKALEVIPKSEIIRVFPKQVKNCKSSMILKGPKTEGSYRKQYLTEPLLQEIRERLDEVNRCKEFYSDEYKDYGLLICHQDGRPIDTRYLDRWFKAWQDSEGIEEQIEFQGLRKSGQMHKVRLTQNNYQLVAENSGQSPEVLMSNYNEARDSEKRALSMLVENSFYPQQGGKSPSSPNDVGTIVKTLQNNPELTQQILQLLLSNAVPAK